MTRLIDPLRRALASLALLGLMLLAPGVARAATPATPPAYKL